MRKNHVWFKEPTINLSLWNSEFLQHNLLQNSSSLGAHVWWLLAATKMLPYGICFGKRCSIRWLVPAVCYFPNHSINSFFCYFLLLPLPCYAVGTMSRAPWGFGERFCAIGIGVLLIPPPVTLSVWALSNMYAVFIWWWTAAGNTQMCGSVSPRASGPC